MNNQENGAKRKNGSDLNESFALLFFGLVCGALLIFQTGITDYDALTVLFVTPVILLAIAKGFRYGAILSIISGAAFGTLILLRILQGTVTSGFIVHNIANLAIIIGFGFVLGIISEYYRFGLGDQWRQETTIIETFIPDEETGLYNFKSFRWMLRGDIARLNRYKHPMSVIFVRVGDLGNFRGLYEEIDEAKLFREIGIYLRQIVRESDYIGRYSDDEVALALPETDKKGCDNLIRRLKTDRNMLMETILTRWKDAKLRFQISNATFPGDAKSMEELVDVIDSRYEEF